jgi:hypothetical protein
MISNSHGLVSASFPPLRINWTGSHRSAGPFYSRFVPGVFCFASGRDQTEGVARLKERRQRVGTSDPATRKFNPTSHPPWFVVDQPAPVCREQAPALIFER